MLSPSLLKKVLRLVAAFFIGASLTLSFAPYFLWWLPFLALPALFLLLDSQTARFKPLFATSFAFALGYFAVGISWVHVSIATYGGLPLFGSLGLMLLLCGYLALYPTLALALAKRYQTSPLSWLLLLGPLWVVFEWLRGKLLTGFGWLSLGYSQTDGPMYGLSNLIGERGLTLWVVLTAAALYLSIKAIKIKEARFAPLLLVAFIAFAFVPAKLKQPTHKGESLDVLLVQGNIAQSLRWEPEQFWPTMSAYQDMTRTHWDVDLVVWPEAAIPEIEVMADDFLANLDRAAAFNDTALITGIVDYQRSTKAIFNTLVVVGKEGAEDQEGHYTYLHENRYQKHQLLPIGEFVPFEDWLRPIAPLFDLPMSSFTRGERKQANLVANGYHVLPAICYEIAFVDLVKGNATKDSDILFTVSNDAWFGNSHGPHQHMQIARMRASELGLPLVRVTNNGISGVFDPLSRQQVTMAQFERGAMRTELPLLSGMTFYRSYGDAPLWGFTLLSLLGAIGLIRKKAS